MKTADLYGISRKIKDKAKKEKLVYRLFFDEFLVIVFSVGTSHRNDIGPERESAYADRVDTSLQYVLADHRAGLAVYPCHAVRPIIILYPDQIFCRVWPN